MLSRASLLKLMELSEVSFNVKTGFAKSITVFLLALGGCFKACTEGTPWLPVNTCLRETLSDDTYMVPGQHLAKPAPDTTIHAGQLVQ